MNNLHEDRMRDQEWSERQDRIAQWKERHKQARLIAAAPSLLEACKMLLRWCKLENQDDPDIEELTLQTVHEHVEAAIARAEGGVS